MIASLAFSTMVASWFPILWASHTRYSNPAWRPPIPSTTMPVAVMRMPRMLFTWSSDRGPTISRLMPYRHLAPTLRESLIKSNVEA